MQTILYASRATAPMAERELTDLLVCARNRNAREDVTGMLIYAYGSFMQQLEGPDAAVEGIFASIRSDTRHADVRVLSQRPIRTRRFGAWAMRFESPDHERLRREFDAYHSDQDLPLVSPALITSAAVAEALLLALAGR